ncbi:hypothetical protein VTO42DRAFT_1610 [Malbranchea cinnamomea]
MTTSASTRIRDNQRRSRARHREYVRSLEERLRRFEKEGVQATLEVQLAGRKVAEENKLLRSLLRLHGVGDADIEAYLRAHRAGSELLDWSSDAQPSPNTSGFNSQDTEKTICSMAQDSPGACVASEHSRPWMPSAVPVKTRNTDDTYEENRSPVSTSSYLSRQRTSTPETRSGHATPCEDAARIIASMRHDSDLHAMRAELGCSADDSSCMVQNMTIFRLLDR